MFAIEYELLKLDEAVGGSQKQVAAATSFVNNKLNHDDNITMTWVLQHLAKDVLYSIPGSILNIGRWTLWDSRNKKSKKDTLLSKKPF